MKKIFVLIIFLSILVILCNGCQGKTDTLKNSRFDTVLYKITEEYQIFRKECTTVFEPKEFVSTTAKQTLNKTILGTEYKFVYEKSTTLSIADLSVDVYKIEGTEYSRILVNPQNGEIVKYIAIPYDKKLTTEQEYIDFIKNFLQSKFELSQYDYKCTTHYYEISDAGIWSKVVDGFINCDEKDRFGSYTFYYTKLINGVKTGENIVADIKDDKFTLQIYDLGYDTDMLNEAIELLPAVRADIEACLKAETVKEDHKITDVAIGSETIFVKDGVPHLLANVTVTFYDMAQKEYTTTVQTISKLSKE